MVREAVFVVVGLVGLVGLVVLAVRVGRLRVRVSHLEREGAELSRVVAAVQGWAAKEIRAVRGEFTVSRVNASAASITARRTPPRDAAATTSPEPDDDPDERRDTVEMPAPVLPGPKPSDDEDATNVEPNPPMYAARLVLLRPPAPLADPNLIGSEDAAEEAVAYRRLGAEDPTPRPARAKEQQ